jgi:enamine deaminase RidA (YjgF/YER057c/UK114 family)
MVPRNPYSQTMVVRGADLLFISGQGPIDENGNLAGSTVAEQTRQVFENLETALGAHECGWEDVVKLGVFLTDIADFPEFAAVREEFLAGIYPAATLVADIALVMPDWKVEVEAVAALP